MGHRIGMIAILFAALCFNTAGQGEEDRFRIVATTTQAADLMRILSADVDGLSLTALMGPGVDPHLYQPTEADIVAMNAAQMVVYSGLHLEGQFDAVFSALAEQGIATYALSAPVKDAGFIIGGFDLSDTLVNVDDPHFWFDPLNWQLAVAGLADALAALDPANAQRLIWPTGRPTLKPCSASTNGRTPACGRSLRGSAIW